MKPLLFALIALACCTHAPAQDAQAGDRVRIADERKKVQERHAAEEKACYARFAVNDCLDDARARRREVLAELRRQEVALNDRERQSKGAARLRALEEKAPPDPALVAQEREKAAAVQAGRESAAEKKAARAAARTFAGAASADAPARKSPDRAAKPPKPPRQASAGRAANGDRGDNGDSLRRRQQRLEAADARRQRIEKRLADRHKAPPAPLPVPP